MTDCDNITHSYAFAFVILSVALCAPIIYDFQREANLNGANKNYRIAKLILKGEEESKKKESNIKLCAF